jgi:hypothetical protein
MAPRTPPASQAIRQAADSGASACGSVIHGPLGRTQAPSRFRLETRRIVRRSWSIARIPADWERAYSGQNKRFVTWLVQWTPTYMLDDLFWLLRICSHARHRGRRLCWATIESSHCNDTRRRKRNGFGGCSDSTIQWILFSFFFWDVWVSQQSRPRQLRTHRRSVPDLENRLSSACQKVNWGSRI